MYAVATAVTFAEVDDEVKNRLVAEDQPGLASVETVSVIVTLPLNVESSFIDLM